MNETMKDRIKWTKRRVSHIPRERLLPVSQTVGMRDVIKDTCGYDGVPWKEVWDILFDQSRIVDGGLMTNVSVSGISYYLPDCFDEIRDLTRKTDFYMCSDGRIRYYCEEEE